MAYYVKRIINRIGSVAGETLIIGEVIHIKDADARAYKADADASALRPANGIISKGGISGQSVEVVILGKLKGWSDLQEGLPVYLSTTPGEITQTSPNAFSQQIGIAVSSTEILFDFMDYTAHAIKHIRGGYDELDGDKLDIDWNPSGYTPDTSPSEVDNADHLTAHLKGIDSIFVYNQIVTAQAFNGQNGKTVTIPTAMPDTSYEVAIIPLGYSGFIGEISVESKAQNTFVVKNTGSDNTTQFAAIIRR